MAIATFDTLKFANTLKAAGVPDKQAEAEAAAFAEVIQINFRELVTKADLDQAVKDLRREIGDLRTEVKRDIADARGEIADARQEARVSLREEAAKIEVKLVRIQGELVLMRWMLGATLTAVMGIFVRLFFFKMN